MKHFLKGTAVAVVILIILLVINMICNINGHELEPLTTGVSSAICAVIIYRGLIKNEKNKE